MRRWAVLVSALPSGMPGGAAMRLVDVKGTCNIRRRGETVKKNNPEPGAGCRAAEGQGARQE